MKNTAGSAGIQACGEGEAMPLCEAGTLAQGGREVSKKLVSFPRARGDQAYARQEVLSFSPRARGDQEKLPAPP